VVRPPRAAEPRDVQRRCKINIRNKKQIIFAQQLLSCRAELKEIQEIIVIFKLHNMSRAAIVVSSPGSQKT